MTITKLTGALLAALALDTLPAQAAIFTDVTAFDTAAAGLALKTDNFSADPLGTIIDGQNLGGFRYFFDSNQTQPAIVANQTFTGNALGGAPFGVFGTGDSVTLTSIGPARLRAFGMDISAAPAFGTTLPDDIYHLTLLDGNDELVGNVNLSTSATDFFLGFVEDAASTFTEINLSVLPAFDDSLVPAIQVNALTSGTAPVTAAPEPASLALLVGGLAMAGAIRRRRATS